jgi:hypothetical protein
MLKPLKSFSAERGDSHLTYRFLCSVLDQLHESVVHVQLLMAMPQRVARIIGDEIHFNRAKRHNVDNIFHQAAQMFVADARHFKGVPVQMERMLIAAAIAKHSR